MRLRLDNSYDNHEVIRNIPDLSGWWQYYNNPAVIYEENLDLWQSLSSVINVPYEDLRPDDYMCGYTYYNVAVYRPNHDVAHAIRKFEYAKLYLDLLQNFGDYETNSLISNLTNEERAGFLLLCFLERSGRTNELSSNDDYSNITRSLQLFGIVASNLGFNPSVTDSLKAAYQDYHTHDYHGFTGNNRHEKKAKTKLLYDLFLVTHYTDLLRCRPTKHVETWIFDTICQYIPSDNVANKIANKMVNFAELSMENTGTNYDPKTGSIFDDDPSKKVNTLLNVNLTMGYLASVANEIPAQIQNEQGYQAYQTNFFNNYSIKPQSHHSDNPDSTDLILKQ